MTLNSKKFAILIAPRGTEEPEFIKPKSAVEQAGGTVTTIGIKTGEPETVNSDLEPGGRYVIDVTAVDARAEEYDGLIIPGGTVGSDTLRGDKDVVALVRAFFAQGKPAAVICHGPWLLVEADVVKGRTLTSYPSLRTDIVNAGGTWIDQEVVVDAGLVTSRSPHDLPAFCEKLVEEFAEGRHQNQARSA